LRSVTIAALLRVMVDATAARPEIASSRDRDSHARSVSSSRVESADGMTSAAATLPDDGGPTTVARRPRLDDRVALLDGLRSAGVASVRVRGEPASAS
jgi:hypothetical protein